MILRPFAWPEYVWAVAGAALLVLLGLLPVAAALAGVARGTDVYLFLIGMMLLAELARQEGLFDWLAARAARLAKGSATRLFTLVFGVGTLVTVFLSNDATAVVLTPAVAAVVRAAQAKHPLPYLLACAFIANAASFVLPISNPANLVIYGSQMPPLLDWLPRYALPSLAAILATYGMLRLTQRAALRAPVVSDIAVPALSAGGRMAALGIAGTACVLLLASAWDWPLGLPTFVAGLAATGLVLLRSDCGPLAVARGIAWGVLPLVAGLFVLVEALERTGVTAALARLLAELVQHSVPLAGWVAALVTGFGSNLVNNLPAGLVAGRVVE
ncbi:MAG: arsenic transporter, partial [Acetobacteraceae bacterium]